MDLLQKTSPLGWHSLSKHSMGSDAARAPPKMPAAEKAACAQFTVLPAPSLSPCLIYQAASGRSITASYSIMSPKLPKALPDSSQDEICHQRSNGGIKRWEDGRLDTAVWGVPPSQAESPSTRTHPVRLRASRALKEHGNAAPHFWGPLLSTATSTSWEGGAMRDSRACWGDEPRGHSAGCRVHLQGGTGVGFLPHAGASPTRCRVASGTRGQTMGLGSPHPYLLLST